MLTQRAARRAIHAAIFAARLAAWTAPRAILWMDASSGKGSTHDRRRSAAARRWSCRRHGPKRSGGWNERVPARGSKSTNPAVRRDCRQRENGYAATVVPALPALRKLRPRARGSFGPRSAGLPPMNLRASASLSPLPNRSYPRSGGACPLSPEKPYSLCLAARNPRHFLANRPATSAHRTLRATRC